MTDNSHHTAFSISRRLGGFAILGDEFISRRRRLTIQQKTTTSPRFSLATKKMPYYHNRPGCLRRKHGTMGSEEPAGGILCKKKNPLLLLSSSSSRKRCQDCGNQAKKDCEHSRCRNCCKRRNFQCETHVKSTWVPVSRRKPRQHIMNSTIYQQQQIINNRANPRSFREHPASLDSEGGARYPGEMSFPAEFKCVRVSSVDDNAVDEYAYQASVNIGGRVFSGLLYDQGEPEGTGNFVTGENLSAGFNHANSLQHPFMINGGTSTNEATGTTHSCSSPFCAYTSAASHFF